MSLRSELIQVAAVAVAIVEDLTDGQAYISGDDGYRMQEVLKKVADERWKQDGKYGSQHHDIQTWMRVLMEEVGEASEVIIEEGLH